MLSENINLLNQIQTLLQDSDKKFDIADAQRFLNTSSAHNGDQPVVDFLNWIFFYAAINEASDVHFRDQENGCMVRIRNQNMKLVDLYILKRYVAQSIDAKIRAKCKMSSYDRESPQDGSFWLLNEDETMMIDVRVSICPTKFGQSIICRILDQSNCGRSLDSLYLSQELKEAILKVLNQSQGMILVSGPTGSGKTSTLYSFLNLLNKPDVHIVTAEDPVEYHLHGANQVNIHAHHRSFSSILRAFLRQDPDVIMIGEIRDLETADIASTAANTGHLVLSTIHTKDAMSIITRLIDLGIERYKIADTITAFFAQRLLNKLCTKCSFKYKLTPAEKKQLITRSPSNIYYRINPQGCEICNFTGISGKIPIIEFALNTPEIQQAILENKIHLLQDIVKKQKTYRTLTESALEMSALKLVDFETAMNIL